MSTGAGTIVLFGATGYTGTLIARELDSRCIPFTIAARDEARGRALQSRLTHQARVRVADVTAPDSLARALDGAAIVVNCVGPYNVFAAPLIEACRHRDTVYVDLSGEQEVVLRSLEAGRNGAAATILHSIAFESTLADLLAAEMIQPGQRYARISSYYSFQASRPSPGTRLTMNTARYFPTYCVRAGELERSDPLAFDERVVLDPTGVPQTAVFMPYPEVLFFWKQYRAHEAGSFLVMNSTEAALASAARPTPASDLRSVLELHRSRRREGPAEAERQRQAFTLTVRAVRADGAETTRYVAGHDMYRLTALLVLQVVEFLIAGGTLPKGVLAPGSLPVWSGIWETLRDQGVITARDGVG